MVEDGRTISRKVEEAALAWQLEQQHDKDWIVTAYLNTIYFGNGAARRPAGRAEVLGHGVAAHAARGRAPRRGSRPTRRATTRSRTRATHGSGRNLVLRTSSEQGKITRGDMLAARPAPLPKPADIRPPSVNTPVAPYFANYVKQQLVDRTGRRAYSAVEYRVRTSIDLDVQKAARRAIEVADEPRRPDRGARGDRPARRERRRDGRRRGTPREPVQPRRAGQRPAGLRVQAVRARRGAARAGSRRRRRSSRSRCSSRSATGSGPCATTRRPTSGRLRLDESHCSLRQHDLRAAHAARRPPRSRRRRARSA